MSSAAWEGRPGHGVPPLDPGDAAKAALLTFGLPGTPATAAASATTLPSERDLNVLFSDGAGERWLLKLSNNYESPRAVDMEVSAQDAVRAAGVEAPRALPAVTATRGRRLSSGLVSEHEHASVATAAAGSPVAAIGAAATTPPPSLRKSVAFSPRPRVSSDHRGWGTSSGVDSARERRVARVGGYLARCVSFLPGETMGSAYPRALDSARERKQHHALDGERMALLESWGRAAGEVTTALTEAAFDHEGARRGSFAWDLSCARTVVARYAGLLRTAEEKAACGWAMDLHADALESVQRSGARLRRSAVHNDANENNVIVRDGRAVALIDYGDACVTDTVNDCAIACVYAMMFEHASSDPWRAACVLVRGYHSAFTLMEVELDIMFPLAMMRACVSLAMSTANAAAAAQKAYDRAATSPASSPAKTTQEDSGVPTSTDLAESEQLEYLLISQAPARDLLVRMHAARERYTPQACALALRAALGMASGLAARAAELRLALSALRETGELRAIVHAAEADLNARELIVHGDDFEGGVSDAICSVTAVEKTLANTGGSMLVLPYGSTYGGERRLGMDLYVPAGTRVVCPLAGEVVETVSGTDRLGIAPAVLMRHRALGIDFYCVYGGVADVAASVGTVLAAGQELGSCANAARNGGHVPRVCIQLALSLLGSGADVPPSISSFEQEAADNEHERETCSIALSVYPDSNWLVGVPALPAELLEIARERSHTRTSRRPSTTSVEASQGASGLESRDARIANALDLARLRHDHCGRNLSLSGSSGGPDAAGALHMARGAGQYLYTSAGLRYLDMVNNVAHCGHCEPSIDAAVCKQLRRFNSNSRYLHEGMIDYCARLASLFPPELCVVYMVTSGSEANDLALRMARAATHGGEGTDVIVLSGAYHGHTQDLIEISPYKQDGPGGRAQPAHVLKVAAPDPLRRPQSSGTAYALPVRRAVERACERRRSGLGGGAAAFVVEAILGCGGQIPLPAGYLREAFALARAGGSLCVVDEVQTGFWRTGGATPWAFSEHEVTPDIVTLGKPIANGYPCGAVVTTRAVADAFGTTGMEFFATFGGTPAAAAAATATLDALERKALSDRARERGLELLTGLHELAERFDFLAEARGRGLFVGLEVVRRARDGRASAHTPAPARASWIARRVRDWRVLISTDGPFDNVLKMKPPMVVSAGDIEYLLRALRHACEELAASGGDNEVARQVERDEDARAPRLRADCTPCITDGESVRNAYAAPVSLAYRQWTSEGWRRELACAAAGASAVLLALALARALWRPSATPARRGLS